MADSSASEDTPLVSDQGEGEGERNKKKSKVSDRTEKSAVRRTIALIADVVSSRGDGENSDGGLGAVLKNLEDSDRASTLSAILALFGIASHVLGGAIVIKLLEGWSFYDAVYFCIVTTTTVGYGDITPTTSASKLFVIFYVIVSIALISSLLAYMVGVLLDQQEEVILETMLNNPSDSDDEDEQTERFSSHRERILHRTSGLGLDDYCALGFSLLWLLGVLAVGVVTFIVLEKLSFINAVYVTIISASTVGFGDFEPTRSLTKGIMTVWLIFSTMGVVKVIADFTDASVKVKQRTVSRRLLTAQLDMQTWKKMDKDNDGSVDKAEFVTEFLIRTGKVDREEVDAILARFDELDKDNDGDIRLSEVIAV